MVLPDHLELIGVVLAGGKSSRMGSDKALMSINGKTMLERTVDLLKDLGAKDVIVCRNEDGYLADKYLDAGPVGGIHSVLEHLIPSQKRFSPTKKLKALLILPVDMPLLDSETLAELIFCGAEMYSALHFRDQPLPLFLPVTEGPRDFAKLIVKSDERSIKRFVNYLGCASITTANRQPFINTNDPIQWQKAIEQLTT